MSEGPCLEWRGAKSKAGYGQKWDKKTKKVVYTHRLSYEASVGSIPEGMMVLHRCDNPLCYRPEHLFLGTAKDNAMDMSAKKRQVFQKAPEKHPRGGSHHNSRITDQDAREIRSSLLSQRALAQKYGLAQSTIWAIINKRTWNHVG